MANWGPAEREELDAILESSEEARAMKAEFEKLIKLTRRHA